MVDILYAKGITVEEGEEAFEKDAKKDSKFLDRIKDDLTFGLSHYRERNLEFDRQEDWYYRKHYDNPSPPAGDIQPSDATDNSSNIDDEHLVTINVPFSSVQRAHTMMTGETPTIEVLSKKSGSARVVKLLHGVIEQNSRRWGANPLHDAIFNQLLYGWGVIRTIWNRNEWEDSDKSFKGDRPTYEFPIEVKSLLPREIYPIPGGTRGRWKAVIHLTLQKVYEIEEAFDVKLQHNDTDFVNNEDNADFDGTAPLNPEKEVEVIDYWAWKGNEIIHAVVAHEQFVLRPSVMKFYDSLPFTIFFCAATTSKQGDKIGLSANYALVDSVAELEWLVNRHMRITDLYADPKLVIERVNDEPVGSVFGDNNVLELIEGERAYFLQFQGVIPDLSILQNFFKTQLDEEGFSLPQAGESGLDTIAQQQAALIKIFKPVENAEEGWVDVNAKVIGLLQRYSWNENVQISGIMRTDEEEEAFSFSLKGQDTKGMRDTRVSLRARFPLEELRNVSAAATLKNSGLMSPMRIMKRLLNIQDPENESDLIREAQIADDPQLRAAVTQNRLTLLQQRSTIMEVVAEEAQRVQDEDVTARGEPASQGTPQAQPPADGTQGVEAALQGIEGELGAGVPDNPLDGLAERSTPLG